MSESLSAINYSPVGDIIVIVLGVILSFLLIETFTTINRGYRLFSAMLILSVIAAACDLIYHIGLLSVGWFPAAVVILMRLLAHAALFLNMAAYLVYFVDFLSLEDKAAKKYSILALAGAVFIMLYEVAGTLLGYGFRIDENGSFTEGHNIFFLGYIFYVGMIIYLLLRFQGRIIPQIFKGVLFTEIACIAVLGVQGSHHQSSFTTATFIFPVITLMYLIHSNPYDVLTGAVNTASFENTVRDSLDRRIKWVFMCLTFHDIELEQKLPREKAFEAFRFYTEDVRDGILFRFSNDRMVLGFTEAKNPDVEGTINGVIRHFREMYQTYRIPYKGVITRTYDEISRTNDYQALFRQFDKTIQMNSFYTIKESDIDKLIEQEYIVAQLEDIESKMDLNDERVKVYCQPVYNVTKNRFDTAEALMRMQMQLPDIGFIYPDQFIPLAEQHGLVHPLSMIILNKTCKEIRRLLDEGYYIKRISVNFSIPEVRDEFFCDDIINIIEANDIPYDKIAIELTESQDAFDFELMKEKINLLKSMGIKFYLDDFGTGYSNFDRIMELPIDIVKFDRSLVIESAKDEESAYMVSTFASMFKKLNYNILYEGVEDEEDEKRCIEMCAQYLQGYKYSKPIPIEDLRDYLERG